MVDQEMLLAISNLLDAKIKPLRGEIVSFENKIDRQISQLRDEIKDLRDEVYREINGLKEEVNGLKVEVNSLKEEVNGLKAEVCSLTIRMDAVESRLSSVEKELTQLRVVTLEHDIKPRLEHIEECYVSVSERYWTGTEKIDGMEADIQILKEVVSEHSEKLRKIS